MRANCIAQGPLYSVLCRDLHGKEIQKRRDICTRVANSLGCATETNNSLLVKSKTSSTSEEVSAARSSFQTQNAPDPAIPSPCAR